MELIAYLIALVFGGLVIGALARLAIPGPDPMSVFQTILVGIAGSLIAGVITYYVFDEERAPGFLISLVCAIVIVFAIRKLRERQLGPDYARRSSLTGDSGMQVRFMPGCLIGSLIASLILTVLLNLLIRAF